MSQIEIKIDGRVFKVGQKVRNKFGGERTIAGYNGNMLTKNERGLWEEYLPSELTDIPPRRIVPMTYEDLRDLVACEKGGVEFETKNGTRVLNPDIVIESTGRTVIWSMILDLFHCYRLYSENWAVEHPLTKEVEE